MHVVFVTEKDGKIELTKDELQKMLDEAYEKGRTDVITLAYPTPSYPNPITNPSITWTCDHRDIKGLANDTE